MKQISANLSKYHRYFKKGVKIFRKYQKIFVVGELQKPYPCINILTLANFISLFSFSF